MQYLKVWINYTLSKTIVVEFSSKVERLVTTTPSERFQVFLNLHFRKKKLSTSKLQWQKFRGIKVQEYHTASCVCFTPIWFVTDVWWRSRISRVAARRQHPSRCDRWCFWPKLKQRWTDILVMFTACPHTLAHGNQINRINLKTFTTSMNWVMHCTCWARSWKQPEVISKTSPFQLTTLHTR